MNQKLTLSFGLRYELPSPLTERYNRSVKGFDRAANAPVDQQALAELCAESDSAGSRERFQCSRRPDVRGRERLVANLWNTHLEELHAAVWPGVLADEYDGYSRRLRNLTSRRWV